MSTGTRGEYSRFQSKARCTSFSRVASVEDLSIVEPSITTWTFVTTWHDVCCADALALLVTLVVFETLACETQL